ncbi:MAG: hypothetical protein ACI81P_000396 [Neolewinella sp.]|jgi:hypothetical protein
MKKLLFSCLTAGFLLSTLAFTSHYTTSSANNPVFKIMEVTFLYPLLKSTYEYNPEADQTYLKTGLRANYAMAKPYASLGLIERAFGEKVFLSGPHRGDMNWGSQNDFGHYNPVFLNSIHRAVERIVDNDLYSEMAELVYDEHFNDMLETYGEAYVYLEENPELKDEMMNVYLQSLNGSGQITNETYNQLGSNFSNENPELDIFDAYVAPYFWIRRAIDGTDDEFIKIFTLIYDEFG